MARRRMIDPCIWQSEDFSQLSVLARLVFIGLFSQADDEGRGRCKPVYLKSTIFPYDENLRVSDIEKALSEISTKMSVTFYTHNENDYYRLDNWTKWQRVDKPKESLIPVPESLSIDSRQTSESFPNHSRLIPDSFLPKGKEEKGIEYNIKPICANAAAFDAFWQEYPKKKAKQDALRAFKKLNPSPELLDIMLNALNTQKASHDWTKDGGQYIPFPATWINKRRWEDALNVDTAEKKGSFDTNEFFDLAYKATFGGDK